MDFYLLEDKFTEAF